MTTITSIVETIATLEKSRLSYRSKSGYDAPFLSEGRLMDLGW
jgi:hypothetical protein